MKDEGERKCKDEGEDEVENPRHEGNTIEK